jgi:enoyl-CoA hydratase/carnithine racemase|tara:strand:- start:174 stop:974 length:801 start_codon:yes stop_codon:yes gene_type:complete
MSQEIMDDLVHYQVQNQVAIISLNRPRKLNAFSDELVYALGEALNRFDTDDGANVAIIHGNGRAFSSGADVHQRQLRSREEFLKLGGPQGRGSNSGDLFIKSVNWKPIITAPHGYVLGLAFGIILESDLIVAEEGTRIQLTETSRGLGGSKYWRLMQYRGGSTLSTEIALTGRFFTAEEGHNAGIIDRVAPKGKHLEAALELAQQINNNPPLSVRATVRTRRLEMERIGREAQSQLNALKLFLTEDFHEAAKAFTEKRKPNEFKGR